MCIKKIVQAVKLYKAAYDNFEDISPLSAGIISTLGTTYIHGYPSSFYLLFKNSPIIKIGIDDLETFGEEIKEQLMPVLLKQEDHKIEIEHKVTSAVVLYSKIKVYSTNAKLLFADVNLLEGGLFIEDEKYVYDPFLLTRYTKDTWKKLYNPTRVTDESNSPLTKLILSYITPDKNQAKEDIFIYGRAEILDKMYEEAEREDCISDMITDLRKTQLKNFFKENEYEYQSGMIITHV